MSQVINEKIFTIDKEKECYTIEKRENNSINLQLSSPFTFVQILSEGTLRTENKGTTVVKPNDFIVVRGTIWIDFFDLKNEAAFICFFTEEECRQFIVPHVYEFPLLHDFFSLPIYSNEYLVFHCQLDAECLVICQLLKLQKKKKQTYALKMKSTYMILLLTNLHYIHEERLSIQHSTMMESNLEGKILKFLSENCQHITLEKAADHFTFTPAYFSVLCKKIFHCTFSKKLKQLRFERAEYLLVHSSFAVSDISYKVGYCDHNYFHRLFREKYGCTPIEYRDKMQRK